MATANTDPIVTGNDDPVIGGAVVPLQPDNILARRKDNDKLLDVSAATGLGVNETNNIMGEAGAIGFIESTKEEFLREAKGMQLVPFIGGMAEAAEQLFYLDAARRLQSGFDYSKPVRPAEIRPGAIGSVPARYRTREQDEKLIADLLMRTIAQQQRGYNWRGVAAKGLVQLPTWMLEFMLTGGLAKIGNEAVQTAGEKILKRYSRTKLGQVALKTAGWTGGAVTRASIGLAPRIGAETVGRQVEVKLLGREQEGWATSFAKAWGGAVIEAASEEAGGVITKGLGTIASKVPFGAKFVPALQKAWMKVTGGKKGEFIRKLAAKGGYSNIIGEVGEERLATILRSLTGVGDEGLIAALESDMENLGAELVVLSVPTAGQIAIGQVVGRMSTATTDKLLSILDPLRKADPDKAKVVEQELVDRGVLPKEEAEKPAEKAPAKPAPPAAAVPAQQPIEMTQQEYVDEAEYRYADWHTKNIEGPDKRGETHGTEPPPATGPREAKAEHRAAIIKAIRQGQDVADRVLQDYPDLAAQFGREIAANREADAALAQREGEIPTRLRTDAFNRTIDIIDRGEPEAKLRTLIEASQQGFDAEQKAFLYQYAGIEPTTSKAQPPAPATKGEGVVPPEKPPAPPKAEEVPEPEDALKALKKQLKKARRIIPRIRQEKHEALKPRVGKAAGTAEWLINKKGVPAREAVIRSKGALAGALTQYEQRYESIREKLGQQTVESLHRKIALDPDIQYFEKDKLGEVLDKLLDGTALTLHQARLLGNYFGKDIGEAAIERVALGDRFWFLFLEALNIPRTSLASIDQSGLLRQGRMLAQAHPMIGAEFAKKYAKAFASEAFATHLEAEYKKHPLYKEAKQAGLEMPEWGRVDVDINELAEQFMAARFLQWIPGVRASERSFVTALNWLRLSVYDKLMNQTEMSRGREMSLPEKKHLAHTINNLSGRSTLPKGLKMAAPILNAAFFSPRFALSRLALPLDVITGTARSLGELTLDAHGEPKVRLRTEIQPEVALAIKATASLVATNLAIQALIGFVGGDDVEQEWDPRSSDFGKIKYKDLRVDLWAGYVQSARFLVRLATGQVKTQNGEIREVKWEDTLKSFIQTKQSPIASLVSDWWRGEDMLGRPFGELPKGKEGEAWESIGMPGPGYEIWKRMVPLVIQDTVDAFMLEGIPEAVTAGSLAFSGAGVQTYEQSGFAIAKDKKNELAQTAHKKQWDDLKPTQQKELRAQHKEIAELEREARKDAYPITQLDLTEEANVRKRIHDGLSTSVQQALDEHRILTGIRRQIMSDVWLNEKRYAEYEKLTQENINKRVLEQIKLKSWPKEEPNVQAAILQAVVNGARAEARGTLIERMERGEL